MRRTNAKQPRTADAQPGRLIGYARVSTAEQSLDLQLDALRRAGVPVDHLHTEKVSGVGSKRPGLEAAIVSAKAGDTLVVWKLDRIGRSLRDLLERLHNLEQRGVGFQSLTEGIDTTKPVGRLVLHLMGALAQFERDLIVERTKAGVQARRERGGTVGRKPKMSPAQITEAQQMYRADVPVSEIARRMGVVHETVRANAIRPMLAAKQQKPRKRR